MDMLVPVSPSGTGKMFMSLTCFLCFAMLLEPEMMAFFSWLPKIMGYTSLVSKNGPGPKTGAGRTHLLPIVAQHGKKYNHRLGFFEFFVKPRKKGAPAGRLACGGQSSMGAYFPPGAYSNSSFKQPSGPQYMMDSNASPFLARNQLGPKVSMDFSS